jgi:FHA domain
MTSHAQPLTSLPVSTSPDPQHATHGLTASEPFVVDAFQLLDHRTREHLIPQVTAPAGRYLSVERDGETLLLALTRPITHIGRGLIADVRLEDPHVSRRHAILALRGNGARVLDDRSANGTFVNGRRVTVSQLSDGDVLRFGRAVLRYIEVAPARRAEPLRRIPLRRLHRRRPLEGTAG